MKKFNLSKGLLVGLLTLALCFTCFGMAKASASDSTTENTPTKTTADTSAQYNAATDAIESSANNGKSVVYVLKAKSGNLIKVGATSYQMTNNKITIADLGIKKTTADVYLYICDKEVEVEAGETVSASLVITGNANKVVGAVNYAKVDEEDSVEVLSATYTNKTKKTPQKIEPDYLYWSEDGTTWYKANDDTIGSGDTGRKVDNVYVKNGFRGKDLASKLESGAVIYVKQAGKSGASGTAEFGSKAVKVKVAKQAKAPKVKIDVAKDTLAIKNGFDFGYAKKDGNEYKVVANSWYTILPQLKNAANKEAATSVVATVSFTPLAKKDANAGKIVTDTTTNATTYSYTAKAYKAVAVDLVFKTLRAGSNSTDFEASAEKGVYKIAIRKSATEKKPASAVTLIDLTDPAYAPLIYTQDNVNGQFLVATGEDFSKKGITLGEIAGFPGYTEETSASGQKTVATAGYAEDFKVDTTIAATNLLGKDDGSSFEYLVVETSDLYADSEEGKIDFTTAKWKKFTPAKLKITEKLAGAYSTVKGTKKKVTLKAASAAITTTKNDEFGRTVITDEGIKAGAKTVILIRRQGDKASGIRASQYAILYVVKDGKTYKLYSTVSNGEEATQYTIQFAKWSKPGSSSGYSWNVDESIEAVKVWIQDGDSKEVVIPTISNAAYYAAGGSAGSGFSLGEAVTDAATPADGQINTANKKYKISGTSGATTTRTLIVREGANVTVKAVFSVSGSTTAVGEKTLRTITNGKADAGTTTPITVWVGTGSGSGDAISALSGFQTPAGYKLDPENLVSAKIGDVTLATSAVTSTSGVPTAVTVNTAAADSINTVDATITLNYTVRRYKITIDKNGGTGDNKVIDATGTTFTVPTTLVDGITAPENKAFDGYATSSSGEKITAPVPLTDDTTLYVRWKAVTSGSGQ